MARALGSEQGVNTPAQGEVEGTLPPSSARRVGRPSGASTELSRLRQQVAQLQREIAQLRRNNADTPSVATRAAIFEGAFPLTKVLFSLINERKEPGLAAGDRRPQAHSSPTRRRSWPAALDRQQIVRRPDQFEAPERRCFRSIRCLKH